MAGNFWQSSHYQQWIIERADILISRANDLKTISEEEYQKLMIFFANFIQFLGEHLKVRQQVIATATVYFKRFYAKNSLKCIDPFLLAPTSVYLASKVEEFGLLSQSKLITACQTVLKNKCTQIYQQEYPYNIKHIHEVEFFLLETMDCCLIVYQPYRPLLHIFNCDLQDQQLLSQAWKIVNDSLRTDACLMYAPFQITLACILIASVHLNRDMKTWFSELSVDMDKIVEVIKLILHAYDLWNSLDDKELQIILNKVPTPLSRPPSEAGRPIEQQSF